MVLALVLVLVLVLVLALALTVVEMGPWRVSLRRQFWVGDLVHGLVSALSGRPSPTPTTVHCFGPMGTS